MVLDVAVACRLRRCSRTFCLLDYWRGLQRASADPLSWPVIYVHLQYWVLMFGVVATLLVLARATIVHHEVYDTSRGWSVEGVLGCVFFRV